MLPRGWTKFQYSRGGVSLNLKEADLDTKGRSKFVGLRIQRSVKLKNTKGSPKLFYKLTGEKSIMHYKWKVPSSKPGPMLMGSCYSGSRALPSMVI